MTLTIDDGTFTIGNTFLSLDDIDEYHAQRLTAPWSTSTDNDAKEAAIIRAFDYLSVQNWTINAFDDGIPTRVCAALCVAANKELESNGILQADQQKNIKRKRIEGAIETEYFSQKISNETVFTEINNLIKPYIVAPIYRRSSQRYLERV